jgi:hypothetical protein
MNSEGDNGESRNKQGKPLCNYFQRGMKNAMTNKHVDRKGECTLATNTILSQSNASALNVCQPTIEALGVWINQRGQTTMKTHHSTQKIDG